MSFLMKNSGDADGKIDFHHATGLLDRVSAREKASPSGLIFTWLNFHLKDSDDLLPLTKQIQHGSMPTLRHESVTSGRICYEYPKKHFEGKPAVRCEKGLGFTAHVPIIAKNRTVLKITKRPITLRTRSELGMHVCT